MDEAASSSDLVVLDDYVVARLCIRHGWWGVVFLVLQLTPWVIKLLTLFVKLLEYEAELLHPQGKHMPRIVRRILWIITTSFLINWGLVYYLQYAIGTPALRPECQLLRSEYGMPAPDPALFFQTSTIALLVCRWFDLRLGLSRQAGIVVLPLLNAFALWFNGLNSWLEIGLGAMIGLGTGWLWSAVIIRYVRRDRKFSSAAASIL